MAKGLRSKIKRNFRTQKRDTVREAPWQQEAEAKKQEILKSIVAAPKPKPKDEEPKESEAQQSSKMEVDEPEMPLLTTQNSAKIARKLKARRLSQSRGVNSSQKKKSKPLAGANQFHKTKKKGKRH